MTLTEHQESIQKKIYDSLNKEGIAVLSGIGGTGKTVLTAEIVRHYAARHTVAVTGTTHKAVEVVSSLVPGVTTFSGTIHSFLGLKPDMSGPTMKMIRNTNSIRPCDKTSFKLLVIDEFSMMTKDVIDELYEYKNSRGYVHILLVGDISQLALAPKDLEALDLDHVTHYLEESIRADHGSDIAIYSRMASSFILNRGLEPIIPWGPEIYKYSSHDDFIHAWKETKENKVVLAHQNQVVNKYNEHIKQGYYEKEERYNVGDEVITQDLIINKHGMIPRRKRVIITDITPQEDYLAVETDFGIPVRIPRNKTALRTILEPIRAQCVRGESSWSSYYAESNKYTLVHDPYAMTVHSAQGESFDEVFIDGTDIDKSPDRMRLAYVAISRARKKVHIFLGSKREYKHFTRDVGDAIMFM